MSGWRHPAPAIEIEQGSARDYNAAAHTCGANDDAVSKQLFERLVGDEEGHQNEFERQLETGCRRSTSGAIGTNNANRSLMRRASVATIQTMIHTWNSSHRPPAAVTEPADLYRCCVATQRVPRAVKPERAGGDQEIPDAGV